MKISRKNAQQIGRLYLEIYKLECPYCNGAHIYRFRSEDLASGTRCKSCKEVFLVKYDYMDDKDLMVEDEDYEYIQCRNCEKVHTTEDIFKEQYIIKENGELDTDEFCECGSKDFLKIEVE